jgi:AAA+ superfamily predicted ATPase
MMNALTVWQTQDPALAEVLAQINYSLNRLSCRDRREARSGLLQASQSLYRRAREHSGEQRTRCVQLARRLFDQATRIDSNTVPSFAYTSDALSVPQPEFVRGVGLRDVAGCEEVKRSFLAKFIYPLRHPEKAARYRQRAVGGALLYGPPGTGKTLLVRALAGELAVPVYAIKPADMLSKWLGESEKNLAALFAEARKLPAALIYIDEIDSLALSRDRADGNSGVQRLLTQLLAELDGFEKQAGHLMFVASTNRPWDVDAALLRAGRFDVLAYVPLPEQQAREQMLNATLAGIPLDRGVDLERIAREGKGYSGAEICALGMTACQLAFLDAVEHGVDRPVSAADLAQAMQRVHRTTTPQMLAQFDSFRGQSAPVLSLNSQTPKQTWSEAFARAWANRRSLQSPAGLGDAAAPGPFKYVAARDLGAEIELLPFISYAMQHVGINPVRKITLQNRGKEETQNLMLELALVPEDYGSPWTCNIPEIKKGTTWHTTEIGLPMKRERLRAVPEKEHAHIQISVRDKDELLYAETREIEVLAYNEWLYMPSFLEFTAVFVQPNSPALHPVIEMAATQLEAATGSRAFPGYQRGSTEHVRKMLIAIHDTLSQAYPMDYINPPPSFEKTGQKIRLVADCLAQKRGTCLDLAVLQAALWEHIGLHPCIVLVPGHAFMACWLNGKHSPEPVVSLNNATTSSRAIQTALDDGSLLVVNSVEITARQSFDQGISHARDYIRNTQAQGGDVTFIDIQAARQTVTPLP